MSAFVIFEVMVLYSINNCLSMSNKLILHDEICKVYHLIRGNIFLIVVCVFKKNHCYNTVWKLFMPVYELKYPFKSQRCPLVWIKGQDLLWIVSYTVFLMQPIRLHIVKSLTINLRLYLIDVNVFSM